MPKMGLNSLHSARLLRQQGFILLQSWGWERLEDGELSCKFVFVFLCRFTKLKISLPVCGSQDHTQLVLGGQSLVSVSWSCHASPSHKVNHGEWLPIPLGKAYGVKINGKGAVSPQNHRLLHLEEPPESSLSDLTRVWKPRFPEQQWLQSPKLGAHASWLPVPYSVHCTHL